MTTLGLGVTTLEGDVRKPTPMGVMNTRAIRRGAFLICLALVAAMFAAHNPVGAVPTLDDSPDDVDPTAVLEQCGEACGLDDAADFFLVDQMYERIVNAIGVDRIAGYWFDRTEIPTALRVGVVSATANDEATVDQITGLPARTSVVDRTYSMAQLDAFRSVITPLVGALGTDAEVDSDETLGKVAVELPKVNPELSVAILRAGVPADAFVVLPGLVSAEPTHATRTTYPPYEGGLEVNLRGTGQWRRCTSWFASADGSDAKGVTAGHCEGGGQAADVFMGGVGLGATGTNSYYPRTTCTSCSGAGVDSDALRFNIADADVRARVNIGPAAHSSVAGPLWGTSGPPVGRIVCFQGVRSAEQGVGMCGDVQRINYTKYEYDDAGNLVNIHDHIWRADVDNDPGDSGGPVYTVETGGRARPAGMISMGMAVSPWNTFFHHVQWTLSDLGLSGLYVSCTLGTSC